MSIVDRALATHRQITAALSRRTPAPPRAAGNEATGRPTSAIVARLPPATALGHASSAAPPGADEQRLGQLLVERGHLNDTDLSRVVRIRAEHSGEKSLPFLLVSLGMIAEADMARALADLLDLRLVAASDYPDLPVADALISARFLREYRALPLAMREEGVALAMADPLDTYVRDAVALACARPVTTYVGIASEIEGAIERLYGGGKSQMGQLVDLTDGDVAPEDEDVEQLKDMASEAPVIRLVNLLLQRAIESGASDVHVEPFDGRLKVRYRIDGVLQEVEAPPPKLTAAIISRVKIMAKLNIAERRLPQDGRIKARMQGQDLDVRVSTVPTMHGESVVMRLLNRGDVVLDLNTLGFSTTVMQRFKHLLELPHGMILVTGPTGSGKTTTLYTALNLLNTHERKIITVEDPVEYQLEGINQIQIKPSINLTFAGALRSILRQDPDVIMVGELRDPETAATCVQAALTGHLVLSTLHTNDAASTVTRLLEMGVEDYLLASTLRAVIGQRLVRVLCQHCREPYRPPPELIQELALARFQRPEQVRLYRATGCEHCNDTGYHGRTAVLELLLMSVEISALVMRRVNARELQELAVRQGMTSMLDDGYLKALHGTTSLEELLRVTRES